MIFRIYQEGQRAFLDGVHVCPYPPGTPACESWCDGYNTEWYVDYQLNNKDNDD